MLRSFAVLSFLFCLLLIPRFVLAGEPRLMGAYGDWEAYVFFEDERKVCYMVSQPQKKEGDYSKRGEPFALITHRPAKNTRDVFSYITGYTYKEGGEAHAIIDDEDFALYTQGEMAWGPDSDIDRRLAAAIKGGSKMVVTGLSARGTKTKDTLSLKGSGQAYKRISQECKS